MWSLNLLELSWQVDNKVWGFFLWLSFPSLSLFFFLVLFIFFVCTPLLLQHRGRYCVMQLNFFVSPSDCWSCKRERGRERKLISKVTHYILCMLLFSSSQNCVCARVNLLPEDNLRGLQAQHEQEEAITGGIYSESQPREPTSRVGQLLHPHTSGPPLSWLCLSVVLKPSSCNYFFILLLKQLSTYTQHRQVVVASI